MAITTVLLDVGGVVLDETEHEQVRARVTAEILRSFVPGYNVEGYFSDIAEAVRSFSPNAYDYVIWKHCNGDVPLFDRLRTEIRDRSRVEMPPMKLAEGFSREATDLARDYRLALAGKYGSTVMDFLDENNLSHLIANRYTQDDYTVTKPDPRFLEQVASRCGAIPSECVMVGDRLDNDIFPANLLGMKTVLIRVGLHKDQRPRTPDDLPNIELDGTIGLADAVRRLST